MQLAEEDDRIGIIIGNIHPRWILRSLRRQPQLVLIRIFNAADGKKYITISEHGYGIVFIYIKAIGHGTAIGNVFR